MAKIDFQTLESSYTDLLSKMQVRPEWKAGIDSTARRILANKKRYQVVAKQIGCPWQLIGVIHNLEGSMDFTTCLHNGDPLGEVTSHVPKGRGPFDTWEEGAIDALTIKGWQNISEWTPERECYELERYNGFGYRQYHPKVFSPYLWSGTSNYSMGKYVADGRWSNTAKSGQIGAIPLLQRIRQIDISKDEVVNGSRKLILLRRLRNAIVGTVGTWFTADWFGIFTDAIQKIKEVATSNTTLIIVGVAVAAWVIFKIMENFQLQDYKDGRYIPSGQKDPE